jgi:DNA polymerase-3 subunit gamma/tau
VTPQGFNALLKLVEEPPDHVKFIFATTEPEKVIGTIRSRTHHYPFRLVPPAAMLEYVQQLCETEGVTVEAGVLPLVVRAGGGSPRDTLSLLDQLIAGSEGGVVRYARAVALLGYTHAELLDEVVDALAAQDAAAAFAAVDRVVQTGQDPRRFVDDLLERLRDLIVIAATGQSAASVLRGVSADDLARMTRQADAFGSQRLSRTADLVIATLDEMTGATSPRLQLELMVARVLARGGAVEAPAGEPAAASVVSRAPASVPAPPTQAAELAAEPAVEPVEAREPAAAPVPASAPESAPPAPVPVASGPVTLERMRDAWPEVLGRLEGISRASWLIASNAQVVALSDDVLTLAFQSHSDVAKFKQLSAGAGPSEDLRQAILAVLGIRVKYLAKHDAGPGAGGGAGLAAAPPSAPARARAAAARASDPAAAGPVTEWAVAPIPTDTVEPVDEPDAPAALAVDEEPEEAITTGRPLPATVREGDVLPEADVEPSIEPDEDEAEAEAIDLPVPPMGVPPTRAKPATTRDDGVQRYGEAVVRQVLGATFVREEPYEPPTRFS